MKRAKLFFAHTFDQTNVVQLGLHSHDPGWLSPDVSLEGAFFTRFPVIALTKQGRVFITAFYICGDRRNFNDGLVAIIII